ncbi:MAG: N-acetylneuraminate synthase family protein [Chitinophagales bacterium]|nr:N-acetylneuraminate synthase family protein [Chitinophagales bacterium]
MNNSYLYTETAFHHQGDIEYMFQLIKSSKEAKAKGVKFQVLTNVDDFVSTFHKAYNELKNYCFSYKEWERILDYTVSLDLDIILMPLNSEACDFCYKYNVKYVDIHSVSFNDLDLLQKIKETKKDIIVGIGGRELNEIYDLENYFEGRVKVLMHGFQSFPSKIEDVRLNKIVILKELFPNKLIGYADHSSYNDDFAITSNEYARILGAEVFEKHITIIEGDERVDSASAISGDRITLIIQKLNFLEQFILNTDNLFQMNEKEIVYRNRQLICVASQSLKKGHVITINDLQLKMHHPIANTYVKYEALIGKRIIVDCEFDQPLTATMLE